MIFHLSRENEWKCNTIIVTVDRDKGPRRGNRGCVAVSPPRGLGFSPLASGLNKRSGIFLKSSSWNTGKVFAQNVPVETRPLQKVSCEKSVPCNIYLGSNFTVRINNYFEFMKHVHDNATGGLFHFNFVPTKDFKNMTLSNAAEKILTVPNAGGNSVVSEVLSFEFFQGCFNARLLKVGHIQFVKMFAPKIRLYDKSPQNDQCSILKLFLYSLKP